MMAVALMASRMSNLFTPPLYEALAEKNYYGPGGTPARHS
jgi:hypothetical protein